jgi:hypothetical protein
MNNLNNIKVLLGLSAGINSMAILCHLKEQGIQPSELHLFYAHFNEHSPDSFKFVKDGIRFARKHFNNVFVRIERHSILRWFEENKMIPHPANSPCSRLLKIERINKYGFENGIGVDLVGYVKHELKRRVDGQNGKKENTLFSLDKQYPIGAFTDEWCFEIVKRNIGWYPRLYGFKWNDPGFMQWVKENAHKWPEEVRESVLRRIGKDKRVFNHNNCLPCKNMYPHELIAIEYFYPEYYKKAMELSAKLMLYWGRDKDQFYSTFGRDLGQESTCGACVW